MEQGDVQAVRRGGVRGRCREAEAVPLAVEVDGDLAHAGRRVAALADVHAVRADRVQEPGGGVAVEVLDHAVVREDLHLVVRERHGEEPLALGAAVAGLALGRITGPGLRDGAAGAHGAGGAMVAVRDVELLDAAEGLHDGRGLLGGGRPDGVADAIGSGEAEEGLAGARSLGRGGDQGVDAGVRRVGQEDGAGLGAQLHDVARAVVLLVLPRLLVLEDDVVLVLVHGERGGDARLDVGAHLEPVQVEGRSVLDEQRGGVAEAGEVGPGGLVDDVRVVVRVRRQLDLRTRDAQVAQRVALGEGRGLIRVHHVVGDGRDVGGLGGLGAQGAEGSNAAHDRGS